MRRNVLVEASLAPGEIGPRPSWEPSDEGNRHRRTGGRPLTNSAARSQPRRSKGDGGRHV